MKRKIFSLAIWLLIFGFVSRPAMAKPSTPTSSGAEVPKQYNRHEHVKPDTLIPMGQTAGVQFKSQGLMVVGYAELSGTKSNPAQESGLLVGDFITHIDGVPINSAVEFQQTIQTKGSNPIKLRLVRKGNLTELTLNSRYSAQDNQYKLGAWVRDSISGIGTLTFYDPSSGVFGALGHGINDANTKLLLPIASGSLLSAQVVDVRRGQAGHPGELKGSFEQHTIPGSLMLNASAGLFGILNKPEQFVLKQPLPAAKNGELQLGKAVMLSNVREQTVEQYDIEIVRIFDESQQNSRNFLIHVTDPALIEKTGGIVQGMSGSPIIQNGKIVGAVTHVLVSDPKRGYGIFIDNMLSEIYGNTPALSLLNSTAA